LIEIVERRAGVASTWLVPARAAPRLAAPNSTIMNAQSTLPTGPPAASAADVRDASPRGPVMRPSGSASTAFRSRVLGRCLLYLWPLTAPVLAYVADGV